VRLEGAVKKELGEKWCEHMECIYLAWDRDQWWAVVNKVMNVRVP